MSDRLHTIIHSHLLTVRHAVASSIPLQALALKRRPSNVPVYEAILHEWEQAQHRRELQKVCLLVIIRILACLHLIEDVPPPLNTQTQQAAKEKAELAECTFEPKFVSEPLVAHGKAMRDSRLIFRRDLPSVDTEESMNQSDPSMMQLRGARMSNNPKKVPQ